MQSSSSSCFSQHNIVLTGKSNQRKEKKFETHKKKNFIIFIYFLYFQKKNVIFMFLEITQIVYQLE